MTELKCPYCNKLLIDRGYYDYMCPDECDGAGDIVGNESMWQELIDTKKKLDLAITELKNVVEDDDFDIYMRQLSALTTLEQINNKE